MCLGVETWSLQHLACNINNTIEVISNSFPSIFSSAIDNRCIKWNNDNYSCDILHVDGSCHGTPTITCFGGVLRNNSSFFLAGFSWYILRKYDILLVELSPIYHGLIMAKNLGYVDLACYSDSLVWINLINDSIERYHVYAALIQYIKDWLL